MIEEERINYLEQERVRSLARQDAVNYVRLCDELGVVEPEDKELYQMGDAERITMAKNESDLENLVKGEKQVRKRVAKDETYALFYNDVQKNHVSMNASTSTSLKRKLLPKYFPARFGKKGNQPIGSKDDSQVDRIFARVCEYTRERLGI